MMINKTTLITAQYLHGVQTVDKVVIKHLQRNVQGTHEKAILVYKAQHGDTFAQARTALSFYQTFITNENLMLM